MIFIKLTNHIFSLNLKNVIAYAELNLKVLLSNVRTLFISKIYLPKYLANIDWLCYFLVLEIKIIKKMIKDKTYQKLLKIIELRGSGFIQLIDPDKLSWEKAPDLISSSIEAGVDAFFVGGSFLMAENFNEFVKHIKLHAGDHPVIIFPGSLYQISPNADAILFLSLISGRNPEHLIGSQVAAAPILWKLGLEAISCGYMLIESGKRTSAEFVSNSIPIPKNKPNIALAHALAAQFLGMKTIYLEAGSGAQESVPSEMISLIHEEINVPLIVGGGIRSPETASEKIKSGANIIVVGNFFEKEGSSALMKEFADAVHTRS